ncbi:MAG TPA: sigma-70 family RNA polymerase sigma factor [Propionibacteriaceae bacterium]|nr:sigma-70 family RNA polymerase sigma factor [Propionibacteriaceae bacterium]
MYRQTSQQVYNTALRLLCSRVHAEEVTQEVYVQVWQQAGGYDSGKGSVLSWMRMIARRRAVDRIRAVASANVRDRQAALMNPELEFEDVWDDVASRIDARRVRPALASLSPVQREAVTLMYFERRTMKEISIELRLPLGTVKTRIRDGLISLRRTVDQTGTPDAQSRKTSMLAPRALSRLARSS